MTWQPIATAPKDARVLLSLSNGTVVIGYWSETAEFSRCQERPGWQIFQVEDCYYSWAEDDAVTHWMPLPEAA